MWIRFWLHHINRLCWCPNWWSVFRVWEFAVRCLAKAFDPIVFRATALEQLLKMTLTFPITKVESIDRWWAFGNQCLNWKLERGKVDLSQGIQYFFDRFDFWIFRRTSYQTWNILRLEDSKIQTLHQDGALKNGQQGLYNSRGDTKGNVRKVRAQSFMAAVWIGDIWVSPIDTQKLTLWIWPISV